MTCKSCAIEDYWGEDARYPVSDWQHEVAEGDTRMGYWEWVAACTDTDEGPGDPPWAAT